jgi:hypothetical protein
MQQLYKTTYKITVLYRGKDHDGGAPTYLGPCFTLLYLVHILMLLDHLQRETTGEYKFQL